MRGRRRRWVAGGTSGQLQYNNSGSFGGFTLGGDCTFSQPNITCVSINGKAVTLGAALTTTGAGATTLAFGASGDTYTFPDFSDTVVTLAATQTLTNKTIPGVTPPPPSTGNDTQIYSLWPNAISANGAISQGQNIARCAPFLVQQPQHWDELLLTIITLGTGPLNVALYTDAIDATSKKHQPQTLESSSSLSFTVTSAATVSVALGTAGTGIAIPVGLNWVCTNDTNSGDVVRTVVYASGSSTIAGLIGSTTASNAIGVGFISGVQTAETAGTWPSFVGVAFTDTATQGTAFIGYRPASAP